MVGFKENREKEKDGELNGMDQKENLDTRKPNISWRGNTFDLSFTQEYNGYRILRFHQFLSNPGGDIPASELRTILPNIDNRRGWLQRGQIDNKDINTRL